MRSWLRVPALVSLVAAPLSAQVITHVRMDFGSSQTPTNGATSATWNDVHEGNVGMPFELRSVTGQLTGILFAVRPGAGFVGPNTNGTTAPLPGSAMAEFPPSATRDTLYGQSGSTSVLELTGLDQNTLYDFTFSASRMGVADVRTADYAVQGFNADLATLDASNNNSETVSVTGVLPDAAGAIALTLRAAASNTNAGTQYYYIGAMHLRSRRFAGRPQILVFDQTRISASRAAGKGVFSTPLTVLESTGATPPVALSAVDEATGSPPAWLSMPGQAATGVPFDVTFDESSVVPGSYAATITARASGYPDAVMRTEFTVRDADAKNLLFYGNSYSQGNGTVSTMVRLLAEAAGHDSPSVTSRLVGGQTLAYHLNEPAQAAAITGSLPFGEAWDAVVMQGFSTEATVQLGNPAAFRADALAILTNVRAHSPGAVGVMFQTWARGRGNSVYPGTFPSPLAMHGEIRTSYRQAVAGMNAAFGSGAAFNAAVGDGIALLAFEPSLYTSDLAHPGPSMSLLAGLAIYAAIYREHVCDLDPDLSGTGGLADHLRSLGLGRTEWDRMSGIAERVGDFSLRHFPGSGEDLLLESGVNAEVTACPVKAAARFDQIGVKMTSPNAVYGGVGVLFVDAFATGSPLGQITPFPEVHFHPGTAVALGAAPVLGGGLSWQMVLPFSLPGSSLVFQGLAVGASAARSNPVFATTDAHEVQLR